MAKSKFYELIKNARIEKDIIVILFIILSNIVASAQLSIYTSDDNVESVVYDVEDLYPEEIKVYNQWIKEGDTHEDAMRLINCGRAQDNLIAAPATIIEYGFYIDKNSSVGEIVLLGSIINTSPKTIKEITLQFEFENSSGNPIYDIKTGDKYMIIKLTNLVGRTKSNKYSDIAISTLNTIHHFKTIDEICVIKPFHNKKAHTVGLHSAKIKYTDGSVSTKIAVFCGKSLLENGPLEPEVKHFDRYHPKQEVGKKIDVEKKQYVINKPEVGGLEGYTLRYFPKDKSAVEGTVVVRVIVSPSGGVTSASIVGGSVTDETTRTICRGLAQQTTFRVPMGQVIERTGTLTYTIKEELTPSTKTEKDDVLSSAAHMPSFPGGDGALMKYISNHIIYPISAHDNNIEGKVIVQFVVTKTGKIGEVKVVRSVDKDLDNEAIRVCKSLPAFSPGRNAAGDPVNVWYTLPITFKLQGA